MLHKHTSDQIIADSDRDDDPNSPSKATVDAHDEELMSAEELLSLRDELADTQVRIRELEYYRSLNLPMDKLRELVALAEAEPRLTERQIALIEKEELVMMLFRNQRKLKKEVGSARKRMIDLEMHAPIHITIENAEDRLTWIGKMIDAFVDATTRK
jgi:hypothetical protein